MTSTFKKVLEWTARVQCGEHALGESYSVLLFLGPVPNEQREWRKSPSFAGMHSVYTGYGEGSNEPNQPGDRVSEGYIKLNKALIAHGVSSLLPETVVPVLKEKLDWRVQRASGGVVPIEEIQSVEIEVMATLLQRGPEDKFPVAVGSPTPYHECTAGRAGGYRGST